MKYKGKIAHLCVSVLPAKLKKLAALKQFLILNAFSTKPYLKHSEGE
jgi:hypothetical protein